MKQTTACFVATNDGNVQMKIPLSSYYFLPAHFRINFLLRARASAMLRIFSDLDFISSFLNTPRLQLLI